MDNNGAPPPPDNWNPLPDDFFDDIPTPFGVDAPADWNPSVVDDYFDNISAIPFDDEDSHPAIPVLEDFVIEETDSNNDDEQVLLIQNPQAMESSLYQSQPPPPTVVPNYPFSNYFFSINNQNPNQYHLASSQGVGPSHIANRPYGHIGHEQEDIIAAANQATAFAMETNDQNQNRFASLEMQQHVPSHGPMTSFGADGSGQAPAAAPVTAFGGDGTGVIQQQGIAIAAAAGGASGSGTKRRDPPTEEELRHHIHRKKTDVSVELNVSLSGLTKTTKNLNWPRWIGESGRKILFIHVTRTIDGSTDGLHVARSANLSELKEELENAISDLAANYRISYLEEVIATDSEWRACVQAFGQTQNPCMKLFIHE